MSQRELNTEERNKVRARAVSIAPLLVRLGRTYIDCVTAPNREENQAQEANFADALADVVQLLVESNAI